MKVILTILSTLSILGVCSSVFAKSGTSMAVGLPLIGIGQSALFVEMNTSWGGLGVELIGSGENSYEKESDTANTANEVVTHNSSSEIAILYSRYGNQAKMSGGYYSFGLGYRSIKAQWSRTPGSDYAMKDSYALDEEGRVTHAVRGSGTTMRARGGYRYIAESMPLMIGIFGGIRSFNGTFSDQDPTEDPEAVGAAETSASDLDSFGGKFRMAFEPGIEMGFAF